MVLFFTLLSITIVAVTISTINAEMCIGRTCNSDGQTWCCPSYSPCGDPGACLGVNTTTSLLPRCPGEQKCFSYSSYWCCSSNRKCGIMIGTCKKVTKNKFYFILWMAFLIFIILKWNSGSLTIFGDELCPKRRKANATTAITPPAQNEGVETHAYSMTNMSYPAATANPLEQSYIVLIPTTIPAATTEEDPPNCDLVTTTEEYPPTYDTIIPIAGREQSEV